jgi:hypothetical protein
VCPSRRIGGAMASRWSERRLGGVGGLAPVREEEGRHDRVHRGVARRVRRGGTGGFVW